MAISQRVLLVSTDRNLLHSRKLILGAFFQVEGAGRIQEAEKALAQRQFDLIVLCYSLSNAERECVLALVAATEPQPRILTISSPHSRTLTAPTDLMHMLEAGPYLLLKRSAEILGVEIKNKGRFIAA